MGELYQDSQQSVWNFDGAELYLLFQIKARISEALEIWDLETAYRKLRVLRAELDAKLARRQKKILEDFDKELGKQKVKTEKEEVDDAMSDIDKYYSKYKSSINPDDEIKSGFYLKLEGFYMFLCFLMKKHGLYFREGEDSRLAVLRR